MYVCNQNYSVSLTTDYRSMTRVCRVSGGQLRVSSSRSLCSVSVNTSQLRDTRR